MHDGLCARSIQNPVNNNNKKHSSQSQNVAPILDVQTQPTKPKEHDVTELCKRQEERVPRSSGVYSTVFSNQRYSRRVENPQCQSIVLCPSPTLPPF